MCDQGGMTTPTEAHKHTHNNLAIASSKHQVMETLGKGFSSIMDALQQAVQQAAGYYNPVANCSASVVIVSFLNTDNVNYYYTSI